MTRRGPNDFQRSFCNYGSLDFAVGSVFGARWWYWWQSFSATPHLRGMMAPWRPGVNEAVCLAAVGLVWNGLQVAPYTSGQPDVLRNLVAGISFSPGPGRHVAPHEDCGCGFYAFWNPDGQIDNALPDDVETVRVFGVIEGFGVTLEGDLGFKSQKARIVAATVEPITAFGEAYDDGWSGFDDIPAHMLRPRRDAVEAGITKLYGVPMYSSREELLAKHPTSRPPLERT